MLCACVSMCVCVYLCMISSVSVLPSALQSFLYLFFFLFFNYTPNFLHSFTLRSPIPTPLLIMGLPTDTANTFKTRSPLRAINFYFWLTKNNTFPWTTNLTVGQLHRSSILTSPYLFSLILSIPILG